MTAGPGERLDGRFARLWAASTTSALGSGLATIAAPLLYAVLFVINTGEIVFRSASQAMIPAVVPRARLERANGWLIGGTLLMQQMVAGPLGGFLFAVAASVPFFANAGAPYWIGFLAAANVSASTWRVFSRAAVAQAYAMPAGDPAPALPAG